MRLPIIRIQKSVIFFSIIFSIILALGAFGLQRAFFVDTIRIFGDRNSITNTNALQQRFILPLVDTISLEYQLRLDNPLAKSIVITKQYPKTLEVQVQKRTEIAAVKTDSGFFIVDESGVIITTDTTAHQLPIITVERIATQNNQITETIITKSIQIVSNSHRSGIAVSSVTISIPEQLITIYFDDGYILFPGNKDIDYLFSSLQFLLPQFRIEGKQSVILDFRFDKPVIR